MRRIDIFSYGITCFEMSHQAAPVARGRHAESVLQHINSLPKDLHETSPRPDRRSGPRDHERPERDSCDRWPSMKAMVDELRKELNTES